jgi:hypothetical protein
VLPSDPQQKEHIFGIAIQYSQSGQADGNWLDIRRELQDQAKWPVIAHLSRTLLMAKAARLSYAAGKPDTDLDANVLLAIKAWTDRDPRSPNSWWNEIGVPEYLSEIATLMLPQLSLEELQKITQTAQRLARDALDWSSLV